MNEVTVNTGLDVSLNSLSNTTKQVVAVVKYTRMSSQKQKKAIKKADTYNTIKKLALPAY